LNGHEHATHIDGQHPIKILKADSFDGAQAQNAGIDRDDVEPAKPIDGLRDGARITAASALSAFMANAFRPMASTSSTISAALFAADT
jgi:hypothetical protein